jgi:N-glycosylase/DNA lyase
MLIHNENFNLRQIAESGQCFRMNAIGEDQYSLIALGRYLELEQIDKETVRLSCSEEEFAQVWSSYFDMDYDYGRIVEELFRGEDDFLKKAAAYGSGIRILRQDFFETMISFIISQNKNIPAIKSCIEALCRQYGTPITDGVSGEIKAYAFPSPKALSSVGKEELRSLKVGYRDAYILSAANAVAQERIIPEDLSSCHDAQAIKALTKIHGIGEKVASCICLYGLHHIGAFPVDVWIKRILKEIYQEEFNPMRYEGYMGIIQQYMFYYMRNKKNSSDLAG